MDEKIDNDLWDAILELVGNAYARRIDKDEDGHPKRLLGEIDGLKIFLVDGDWAKCHAVGMDFHEAGNGMYTSWEKGKIPEGEVWLDSTALPQEHKFNLYHELWEIRHMAKGLHYNAAHEKANAAERQLRMNWQPDWKSR